MPEEGHRPDWDRLFETAMAQEGLFTTLQAIEAGYSPPLLRYHLGSGRIVRVRRGIYRVVHFPAGEHEDLVVAWLWSDRVGVVSHQTALALHELSDVMPASVHLTLPSAWRARRLRVPTEVNLHFAEVPKKDRTWFGAVPTTGVRRTLDDCAAAALSPELLRQAALGAMSRGLVRKSELRKVIAALEPFGGLAA